MKRIFQDFDIIILREDSENLGTFLKAKKPKDYSPRDLSQLTLYSIILGKRTASIPNITDMPILRRFKLSINEVIRRIVGSKFGTLLGID